MFLPPPRGSVLSSSVQEAYNLLELANDFFVNADYNQAITHFEKAVPVLRDVDDEYVLRCEYCMAICYGYLNRIDDAISLLLKVDAQNQQYDPMILNEPELADLFRRLSHLYLIKWKRVRQEDSNCFEADLCADDAKLYLQKYLRMCQSGGGGGDLSRQLDAFRRFAAFFYATGDYQSACFYYNHALQLAERLHMEPTQLHCLTCIANSLVALGRLAEAIDTYKMTLDLAMKIQADKAIQAQCTYRLGCALLLTRRYSDAILYFLAHERIASDLGDLEGRLHSLDRLISAYREIGDYAEANKYSQSKDLLMARLNDSGTNEMTSCSIDQTLRSNISAVEQPSQLSGVQSLPVASDSFDNIISRTFDSGQGVSGQESSSNPAPAQKEEQKEHNQLYSFSFIDEGSSQATSVTDLQSVEDSENFTSKKEHVEIVVLPPTPPTNEPPQNDENTAPPENTNPQPPAPLAPVVVEKTAPQREKKEESSVKKKPQKAQGKKHSKQRVAKTLPPEDTEFFDMLTRVSNRRLDDQRAQLKPLRIPVKTQPEESRENLLQVSAIVDVHGSTKNHHVLEEQPSNPSHPQVTRTISNAAAADDLFLMVCKAQARRLDDQRAILRPITAVPNGHTPEIQAHGNNNSANNNSNPNSSNNNNPAPDNAAVRFINQQKDSSSPTSISLIQPSSSGSSSKSSKARRFLSQLMK